MLPTSIFLFEFEVLGNILSDLLHFCEAGLSVIKTPMFTYKILRKEESGTLFVRIIKDRKKAEFKLGVAAGKEEFEKAVRLSGTGSKQRLASYLRNLTTRIDAIKIDYAQHGIDAGMNVSRTRDLVRANIMFLPTDDDEKKKSKLLMPFFRSVAESKKNAGYGRNFMQAYNKIRKFCGDASDRLTFEDITHRWLKRFEEWMEGQGLQRNSISTHLTHLRTVMNRAIDDELTANYPFRRFKIKMEETKKRSLTSEELRLLLSCNTDKKKEFYIDMFKLGFMLCGINNIDLCHLTEITSGGRVEYRRSKTHKLYSIKVEPEARKLIEKWKGKKYLLCMNDRWNDYRCFTKFMNDALKKIGETRKSGKKGKPVFKPYFPGISSYWARHTWASIAYNDLGISKDVISQALGHSNGSKVTDIYIDKSRRLVDDANRRVLDWVLYGKR